MDSRGFTRSAFLRSSAVRNCFISLPQSWHSFLPLASLPTFSLESSNSTLIVTWNGATHSCANDEEEFVSINANLIASSGFQEDELVVVKQIAIPPLCKEVAVEVCSFVEWEELILNFEGAQGAFLNQVRVVACSQIIPLWLDGGSLVNLRILNLTPSLPRGLLLENTQVKVFPPNDEAKSYSSALSAKLPDIDLCPEKEMSKDPHKEEIHRNISDALRYTYKELFYSLLGWHNDPLAMKPVLQDVTLALRVIPFTSIDLCHTPLEVLMHHPSFVMISKSNLNNSRFENDLYFVAKLRKISYFKETQSGSSGKNDTSISNSEDIYIIVLVLENVIEKLLSSKDEKIATYFTSIMVSNSCIISSTLRRQFSIKSKSILNLSTYDCTTYKDVNSLDSFPLTSLKICNQLVSTSLRNHLTDICDIFPVIINPFTLVNFCIEKNVIDIFLIVRSRRVVMLDQMVVRMLQIRPISMSPSSLPFVHKSLEEMDGIALLKSFYELNKDTMMVVKKKLLENSVQDSHSSHLRPEFIMLLGSKGSGKSFIAKSLINELSGMPYNYYCEILKLKKLKGKKVESVQKSIKETLHKGIFYQPSLIVLDDLDMLAQRTSEGDGSASTEYFDHLALMIKSLLQQLHNEMELRSFSHRNHPSKISLAILATSSSLDSLHLGLASSQGIHLFSNVFSIPPLSDEKRIALFEALLLKFYEDLPYFTVDETLKSSTLDAKDELVLCFDRKKVLQALSGLTLRDINAFALRVFFEAKSRLKSQLSKPQKVFKNLSYTDEDIHAAQVNFIPLSKKALKVSGRKPKKIHIGGLAAARKLLEETIDWPSRYPSLFKQSSLRLRSGILLYGPPGCGKTILVNHVARNSSLNYISVKGPELLSKYIGQSEKAVRDAFERAQAAKPCLLFFDEFDSIAPRRGHDNTGVTDRVVNQLLTQMDGVEGLSGVFVLAATSRPDLIDPALLRPGRLDKCIHCPLPDIEEREEILLALSIDMKLEDEIDWHSFAELTEGYSGADLQGILSTAQIKAVQEYLGDSLYEGILNVDSERKATKNQNAKPEMPSECATESVSETPDSKKPTTVVEQPDNVGGNITDDGKSALKLTRPSLKDDDFTIRKSEDESPHPESENSSNVSLYVKKEHLYDALNDVKPSIKISDRAFYEKLYRTFTNSRDSKIFTSISPGKLKTFA